MSAQHITAADLANCHMREEAHYNGGREFFGYGYRCIEHPRIYQIVKYYRKDRSTVIEWYVDGERVADLAAAADRLSAPPTITAQEREALAGLSTEFTPKRDLDYDFEVFRRLADKGLIEWKDGHCRRVA